MRGTDNNDIAYGLALLALSPYSRALILLDRYYTNFLCYKFSTATTVGTCPTAQQYRTILPSVIATVSRSDDTKNSVIRVSDTIVHTYNDTHTHTCSII